MNIAVVGGGPAGLYFALLMKKQNSKHQITVFEQNPATNSYGWGVVFSGKALNFLQQGDAQVYAAITAELEVWDEQTIIHRGQAIGIDGSTFAGIARIRLLNILQQHCQQRGVTLCFGVRITDRSQLQKYDLVVAADGVNSQVRALYAEHFMPSIVFCTNRYIWYGTSRVFNSLSLIFRQNKDGFFVAHCYRYSPRMSTFLVECDAKTWQIAGLAAMSDDASRAYCEQIFSDDLQGHTLQSNKSQWSRFPQVSNQHWFYDNIVLLGDALRSVHFSIGSGTRTAMQDALALAEAFAHCGDNVANALQFFIDSRQAGAEKLSAVAQRSLQWYENFHQPMQLPAIPFAMHYLSRSGELDGQLLQQRSPRFYRLWQDNQNQAESRHNENQ